MAQAPYFGSVELAGHSGLEPRTALALEALPPQAQAHLNLRGASLHLAGVGPGPVFQET
jgi:hypothetical protein